MGTVRGELHSTRDANEPSHRIQRLVWERLLFADLQQRHRLSVRKTAPTFMIMEIEDFSVAKAIDRAVGLEFKVLPEDVSPSCAICFGDFRLEDTVACLPCGHIFLRSVYHCLGGFT